MTKIYCVENLLSGNVYIGKTNKSLIDRFRGHCLAARRGSLSPFHCALRKYGPLSFEISLLEEVNESDSLIREQYWVKRFNSFENGYNGTPGGDVGGAMTGKIHSLETKKRMSIAAKKRYNDPLERIKSSLAAHFRYTHLGEREKTGNSLKGRSCSSEQRSKISRSLKGRKRPDLSRPCSKETREKISLTKFLRSVAWG